MKIHLRKRENGTFSQICEFPVKGNRVQQQFKDETNINRIMEKYHKGMGITHLNQKRGVYGDFTGVKDYSSALQSIINAEKAFMGLPSGIRKRFDNDPQRLIDFISNEANYDEAVKLGIIDKPASAPTQPTINDDAKMAKPTV